MARAGESKSIQAVLLWLSCVVQPVRREPTNRRKEGRKGEVRYAANLRISSKFNKRAGSYCLARAFVVVCTRFCFVLQNSKDQ